MKMTKLKNNLELLFYIMVIILIVVAIVGTKYLIWRAEHPEAKTWTFFITK